MFINDYVCITVQKTVSIIDQVGFSLNDSEIHEDVDMHIKLKKMLLECNHRHLCDKSKSIS